jgi:hypothetical protein
VVPLQQPPLQLARVQEGAVQAPVTQVAGVVQLTHAAPPLPHALLFSLPSATHVVPLQHPLEQFDALQLPASDGVVHMPPMHVPNVHGPHATPPLPHAVLDSDMGATHVLPEQHPLHVPAPQPPPASVPTYWQTPIESHS